MYLEVGVAGAEVQLPNNSIVPPSDFTQTDGVHCCASSNPVIGNWFLPNGLVVNGGQSPNVFSITRLQCIELLLETGRQITAQDEGVYTCNIQDSSGTMRTLFVGIYTSDSYQSSGKESQENHLLIHDQFAINLEHKLFLVLGMLSLVSV